MEFKKITTLISAILFSTLFFKQNIDLNLLLFTLLTIVVLAIRNPKKINTKNTIFKIIGYLITGIAVFLYKSDISTNNS